MFILIFKNCSFSLHYGSDTLTECEIDEIEKGSTNDFNYRRLKTLEAELDYIYDRKKTSKCSQIRYKVKWIEKGGF
jgi:hypothetical protein